jgi:uncharacterized protein YraI
MNGTDWAANCAAAALAARACAAVAAASSASATLRSGPGPAARAANCAYRSGLDEAPASRW